MVIALHAPARAVSAAFAAERERWALWLPVCLGTGIAIYFGLDAEPPVWIGPVAVIVALAFGLASRRRAAPVMLAIVVGTAALGLTMAQLRTLWVAAPVLEKRIGPVTVEGRMIAEEVRGQGRRILLDEIAIRGLKPKRTPVRVRVTVRQLPDGVGPGDRVIVRAILSPPPAPAAPGAFDFSRRAYFQRLGAVGFAVGGVRLDRAGPPDSARLFIAQARRDITARILDAMDAPAGPVAAALMTGKGGEVENYPFFNLLASDLPLL